MCELRVQPGGLMFWRCKRCGASFGQTAGDAVTKASEAADHENVCGETRLETGVEHLFWLLPSPRQDALTGAQALLRG